MFTGNKEAETYASLLREKHFSYRNCEHVYVHVFKMNLRTN